LGINGTGISVLGRPTSRCRSPPPRSPVPRPDIRAADQCGAADLQRLVGRPRTEIPVPLIPNLQRVACTTCPVTQDFSAYRLNIFYNEQTGIIEQVRCG